MSLNFIPTFGWLYRPHAIEAVVSRLKRPTFNLAAPHLKDTGFGQDVFLWQLEEKVSGKKTLPWDQGSDGFCVGFGNARSVQNLLGVMTYLGKISSSYVKLGVAIEPVYGGSRCEIGGWWGDMKDGSLGAYAAKWLKLYGVLLKQKYNAIDLSNYDRARCKSWGAKGVPDELEPTAKIHPISEMAQILTPENARDAICNGYPIEICGNTSRTMKRSPGGRCPKTGNNWPHCECILGHCVVSGQSIGGDGAHPYTGNTPMLVEFNSWGDYLGDENNLVKLASGGEIILPGGSYLSTYEERASDLKQGDSFTYSDSIGWDEQKLTREDFVMI